MPEIWPISWVVTRLIPSADCNGQTGQGAVVFTIGLGDGVLDNTNEASSLPYGTALLRYIAAVGDDGDPGTDPCDDLWEDQYEWQEWCGNYYYSPEGDQLEYGFPGYCLTCVHSFDEVMYHE